MMLRMATQSEVAQHLFLSTQRVRDLLDRGVITRQPVDGYSLDDVRRQYISHLRDVAGARGSTSTLAAERTGLAAAQRQIAEMKLAAMAGQFVSIEDAGQAIEGEYALVREKLRSLSGTTAASLVGCDRAAIGQILDAKVAEILRELSSPEEIIDRVSPDAAAASRGDEAASGAAGRSPGAGAADDGG
jgi:hypothetical protein